VYRVNPGYGEGDRDQYKALKRPVNTEERACLCIGSTQGMERETEINTEVIYLML
jgi:hypothetical protein